MEWCLDGGNTELRGGFTEIRGGGLRFNLG